MPTAQHLDIAVDMLLNMALPAFLLALILMAAITWIGGAKQGSAAAALALAAGALFGLWLRDVMPVLMPMLKGTFDFDKLRPAISEWPDTTLISSESTWNRLPWAILGAIGVGRLARLSDVQSSDGWLLRGGAAMAIAWWVLPETSREQWTWLAPAFAGTIWLQWMILDFAVAKPGGGAVPLFMMLNLLVAGGVLVFARNQRSMDPLFCMAFALFGIWLVAVFRGVEMSGAMPAVVVALPGVLLFGWLNTLSTSQVQWQAFVLAGLAPLTLALTLPCTNMPKPLLYFIRLTLILIPLAIAIGIAQEVGLPGDLENEWD